MKYIASMVLLAVVVLSSSRLCAQILPAQPGEAAFPIAGISFTVPAGAKSHVPNGPGHVAEYTLAGSPGLLLIEGATAKGQTLDGYSKGLVTNAGATIDPASYTIGGEPALKITSPFVQGAFKSRTTYLVFHGNRFYMISVLNGGTSTDAAGDKILAGLVATVHFVAPESPSKHLDVFYKTPFPILNCATMNGPDCLRVYDNKPTYLELGIHDFAIGDAALFIEIQRVDLPGNRAFADFRDEYSAGIQKKLQVTEPVKWEQRKDLPALQMAQPIKFNVNPAAGPKLSMIERFCVLDMGGGKMLQIIFSIPDHAGSDTAAYIALSDKMLKTLTPIKPAATILP